MDNNTGTIVNGIIQIHNFTENVFTFRKLCAIIFTFFFVIISIFFLFISVLNITIFLLFFTENDFNFVLVVNGL